MKDYAKLKKLTDDDLNKVSGGYDNDDGDNTVCAWNPNDTQQHEWINRDDGRQTCKYCGVYM